MTALRTTWLGFSLKTPLVVGASPLTDDEATLMACVDAGASAVVMRSLFEEQIVLEQLAAHQFIDAYVDTDAEARSFLPASEVFSLGTERYIERMKKLSALLPVPVIASLNGTTPGGWTRAAKELADAGAAALELNLYDVVTDVGENGQHVEKRQLEVVRAVTSSVHIPVSVKISPFYSSVPAFVRTLEDAGARGVVLFNRFYQPDVDLDAMELSHDVRLSSNAELPQRLHALAVLYGKTPLELACSGGVHRGDDAAKALLCGATVVQLVSSVLRSGAQAVHDILTSMDERLSSMGYQDLDEARGAFSLLTAPNPHTFERLNYARILQGWQGVPGARPRR
jgi:dihydroorotate dehydrogenase (fumarate)